MKSKSVNFSASNAKCSVKFASVNENLLHAATDNNNCLFTFWVNSEWSCERHTGLFTIRCVYSSALYSLMWMHLKMRKFYQMFHSFQTILTNSLKVFSRCIYIPVGDTPFPTFFVFGVRNKCCGQKVRDNFSSSGFTFMVCIGHVRNQNDSCVITQVLP